MFKSPYKENRVAKKSKLNLKLKERKVMRPEAAKQDIELKAQKQTLGKKRPEECKGKTNYTHLER